MGRTIYHRGGLSLWRYQNKNAKGTNLKVVNGQRIKHYISGTHINVESNIIQTMTPEEHIKDLPEHSRIVKKEEVRDTVSKWTPKNSQKYFLSVLEYYKN